MGGPEVKIAQFDAVAERLKTLLQQPLRLEQGQRDRRFLVTDPQHMVSRARPAATTATISVGKARPAVTENGPLRSMVMALTLYR